MQHVPYGTENRPAHTGNRLALQNQGTTIYGESHQLDGCDVHFRARFAGAIAGHCGQIGVRQCRHRSSQLQDIAWSSRGIQCGA
jgi:hypothetical protein